MSGVTIGWDETNPADSKNLGLGAGDIRSILSNARGGLDAEHLWPAAGGLSGVHRAGSARIYVGTASQISSVDTDGRLMYIPATKALWYLSSATTTTVQATPDNSSYLSTRMVSVDASFARVWPMRDVIESGRTILGAGIKSLVTIPLGGLDYTVPPTILALPLAADNVAGTAYQLSLHSSTITMFVCSLHSITASGVTFWSGAAEIRWMSMGTANS